MITKDNHQSEFKDELRKQNDNLQTCLNYIRQVNDCLIKNEPVAAYIRMEMVEKYAVLSVQSEKDKK